MRSDWGLGTDQLTATTKYENHKVPYAPAEHDKDMPDAANDEEHCEYHSCPLVRVVAIRIAGHIADFAAMHASHFLQYKFGKLKNREQIFRQIILNALVSYWSFYLYLIPSLAEELKREARIILGMGP